MKKKLCANKKWLLPLLLALICLQVATGSALAAQETQVELSLPGEGKVGEEAIVVAVLAEASGSPLQGVEVVFYTPAEFANVSGEIEIGQSVTDEQGVASLVYTPRSWGEQTVIVRFAGDSQYSAAESSAVTLIEPGPQLHQEEAGVDVPGIGVWLLVAVLGVVWTIYLVIAVLLELIARKGVAHTPY